MNFTRDLLISTIAKRSDVEHTIADLERVERSQAYQVNWDESRGRRLKLMTMNILAIHLAIDLDRLIKNLCLQFDKTTGTRYFLW